MALACRAARLLRRRDFRNHVAKIEFANRHFGDKNSNERDVLGHFTSAGIVRDRIGIHADEIGKAAYTEARTLKLSEEFSVRHFTISSYTVFDVP